MADDPAERTRRRGGGGGRALFALVAALVAHVGFVALISLAGPGLDEVRVAMPAVARVTGDDSPMEISTLLDALDRPDTRTEAEQRREEKKKQEEDKLEGQVVDIARPALEERPEHARFAAEYDSTVDKEKRGPHGRDKAGAPMPTPASDASAPSTARAAGGGGKSGFPGEMRTRPVATSTRTTGHDGLAPTDDGDSPRRSGTGHEGEVKPDRARPVAAARPGEAGEEGDGRAGQKGVGASVPKPDLQPNREMLQHAIGAGPGSLDYLKDLDDGDATALNAKKTKFASFFNRMKTAVAQEWNPSAVYVQNDPSGNVYGVKDRITTLRVVLQPDGKLLDTHIIQSSGVGFLDDEAVAAFKKSQPFANPPAGLVGSDGQIQFTFGFIFELSGKTALKVYKYR